MTSVKEQHIRKMVDYDALTKIEMVCSVPYNVEESDKNKFCPFMVKMMVFVPEVDGKRREFLSCHIVVIEFGWFSFVSLWSF